MRRYLYTALLGVMAVCLLSCIERTEPKHAPVERRHYAEVSYPTPNIKADSVNRVEGIILHHTALPTLRQSLDILTSPAKRVSAHCVIDTDGTRYILCQPEDVAFHAGKSVLNNQVGCNYFTVGIEFQGNTLVSPLTDEQIESAIDYIIPLIDKYEIPMRNIVTHEMVRTAYKQMYPYKRVDGKVDITQKEYNRFMYRLVSYYTFRGESEYTSF